MIDDLTADALAENCAAALRECSLDPKDVRSARGATETAFVAYAMAFLQKPGAQIVFRHGGMERILTCEKQPAEYQVKRIVRVKA